MGAFDRLSDRFEGRWNLIGYGVLGLVALGVLLLVYSWWGGRNADKARFALGKAIQTANAPVVTGTPLPNQTGQTFPSERERAQKALEEFREVQQTFGSPYSDLARFFAATSLLTLDRPQGLGELEQLTKSGNGEIAARSKFALAQAREADGQHDAAAALYQELLNDRNRTVSENTLKLRLASAYEAQGKRDEAVNVLFQMVEAARKAPKKEGETSTESAVIRAAAEKLQTLNPERHAQLPPAPVSGRPSLLP